MQKLIFLTLAIVMFHQNAIAQFDERFYYPKKVMQKIEGLSYQNLRFQIDSDVVTGIWIKPTTKVKANILYFHGSGGNVSTYIENVRTLVENGFQVFMIDFRGYGLSTGKPTHINIAGDAQIVFNQLAEYDEAKDHKWIVVGASMGSQVAAHLTKNNASKIHALVLDGAMSSFTDVALVGSPKEMHEAISTYVTSPYSAKNDIVDIANVRLLVIHGLKDKAVPITQARAIFNNATSPKTFWEYEGDHLEAQIKFPADWLERIELLLQK